MGISGRLRVAALAAVAAVLAPASSAWAVPPDPGAYQENDFGGGRTYNIVPPGQNGFESAADVAAFMTEGRRPKHQYDQNDMYANLVYESPKLGENQILDFFKDGSFGVKPGNVERIETPSCGVRSAPSAGSEYCDDVTIVRDQFGVPHVYGENRAALMFGLGYVTGEDRLVLADALRNAGRANLSSFAGGANVDQDADTFFNAPYMNDGELQLQYDQADDLYGEDGVQVQEDVQNYVDGMNQWIAESRLDPAKQDALYAALGRPYVGPTGGPEPWKVTDVIATGALVAGIFGKGGGGELDAAIALQDAQKVLGKKDGTAVWKDFRSADDPEADRTVAKKVFPYRKPPKGKAKGLAMPDPGSVEQVPIVAGGGSDTQSASEGIGLLDGLTEIDAGSNALLVSARESESGFPIAVFGPQTGYFAPQLLMEQDAHAPAGPEGPAIDARGVSFTGTNLYVQLGRGVDYSWSATSSGQDIIDTYAVKLCEPDGSKPSRGSESYVFDGECTPMDVLTKTNTWVPNAADDTPPGSQTLRVLRTKVGLVRATATIKGKPYAYTQLRATYKREVDSAISFADWNSPDVVKDAKSWQRSAYSDDLTFNWFYADDKNIAYINSGANPVRPKGTHPNFPVMGKRKFLWKDYNPDLNTFARDPFRKHAQVIDQRYLTSWNNKQAKGYRCDGIRCFTPIYRSTMLDRKIEAGIKGKKKMSLVELIDAMESAGTTDLRGFAVVPFALKALAKGPKIKDPEVRAAIATMRAWVKSGAHRLDKDNDGVYDNADAVRIMDAWWPLWVKGQFEPTLGEKLQETFIGKGSSIHDAPRAQGSAFQNVVYGFVEKDLRSALGLKVKGAYSRVYCGKGKLSACSKMLASTLKKAAGTSFEELYGSEGCEFNNGTQASPQMCGDAVNPTDLTAAPVGEFHWINRPTYQQAVEYRDGR